VIDRPAENPYSLIIATSLILIKEKMLRRHIMHMGILKTLNINEVETLRQDVVVPNIPSQMGLIRMDIEEHKTHI
jgi:hypothetical protein